jgi:ABC-type cobalamin/Fe3+-siderophores transport system ATPase subunit
LAEALCKVLQEHEARGEMSCFDASTLAWWEEHKARDRMRVAEDLRRADAENARQAALDKLTPFERQLLGLRS